jgi:hypothetical protein
MAAVNYDTCPMEGFDSLRVKKNIKFTSWNQHDYRLRNSRRIWRLWERFRIPLKKFILNYKTTLLF